MARTVELISMVDQITKHFNQDYIENKFNSYVHDLEGVAGIWFERVKQNASLEIMDSLIAYGKRIVKGRSKFFPTFLSEIKLSEKDKNILYDRLMHHYSILKN